MMSQEKDLRTMASDYAIANCNKGFNCTEAIYDALLRCGALKVPQETIALSFGFGGGIGLTGHTCGALCAVVLACGAAYGRPDPWRIPEDERIMEIRDYYRRYNKIVHDFIAENKSASCKELCAPFGDFQSRERRVYCMKLIGRSAAMAVDFLSMSQDEAFDLPFGENLAGAR
ncbi:C-GCAxxG-C-C family protein [Candidatus Formimonas warabiya]|uniref:C_GCAxxG_C_C family protein n=1 Tax=Formimonas warabiya TaxID=1761012 RepID=A0A3G1KNH2_FORW1|nr:C-GCAxxG-C-C family protein [Candidatus Formimonas warabiya]ATW24014.1 hypothetical protein DCMF_03695 [Candidatus Formimonas warabiya]